MNKKQLQSINEFVENFEVPSIKKEEVPLTLLNLYRLYPSSNIKENTYNYEIIPIHSIKYEKVDGFDSIKECFYDDKYNMYFKHEYIYYRKRLKTNDIINETLIFNKDELLQHFKDRRRLSYDDILNEYRTIAILDAKITSLEG